MASQGARQRFQWLRPVVDGSMAVLFLAQMVPGKVGNPLHEAMGVALALSFALHHVLNWGWLRRLGHRRDLRSRLVLVVDVLLTACVAGIALTGILMSRSVVPALSVASLAHVVRPLHSSLTYLGFLVCAFHVGMHVRAIRGYLCKNGRVQIPWAQPLVAVVVGAWAFVRLGVAGKLMGQPSFPDGMTPLIVQLAEHLALALPLLVIGSMVDASAQGKRRSKSGD